MSEEGQTRVIIRRIKKIKKSGHHGGSWKIAYADFVTAMMAFFLIMWILSMLNKSQLTSVAEYFKDPKKTGVVPKGSRVNKDKVMDNFLEKGVQKGTWKDVDKNKQTKTKTEDEKIKIEQKNIQVPLKSVPSTNQNVKPKALSTSDAQLQQLEEMKKSLEEKIANDPNLQQYKNQLNFIVTSDGLKIVLKDLENKPMFSTGKTDFEKYAVSILSWLSGQLNQYPNQIVIIGHTDSVQYTGDQYTNWELSADRANATRRTLIKYGMDESKILSVMGNADKVPLDPDNSLDPSNRRIDIIVLTDEAAKKIRAEDK